MTPSPPPVCPRCGSIAISWTRSASGVLGPVRYACKSADILTFHQSDECRRIEEKNSITALQSALTAAETAKRELAQALAGLLPIVPIYSCKSLMEATSKARAALAKHGGPR